MNPPSLVNALFVLLVMVLSSGCSTIARRFEAERVRHMSPTEQLEHVRKQMAAERKQKAVEGEKLLNVYFAEKRVEFGLMKNDAEGLRATRDIALKAQKEVESVRSYRGDNNYTWPQMRDFSQALRAVRDRQIAALKPRLTNPGNFASQESGYSYLIQTGPFADTANPIFHEAESAHRSMQQQRMAENLRRRDEQANQAADAFVEFLKAAAEAKQKQIAELKAKGICPDCQGDGKITITTENKCHTCAGTGVTYVRGGICPVCGGGGTIGIASTHTKQCQGCAGSGKYPKP